ncbi:MAG: L,D-transpeptidase [Verrucomicrobiales bacterium]|jgi:lipoprotein-anchoring transpeptidase ErfK/SrfK
MISTVNITRLVTVLSFTVMALAGADAHPFSKGNKSRPAAKHAKNRAGGLVVNNDVLSNGGGKREVIVDINKQRAYLLVSGVMALNVPVSTARSGKHTPRGSFRITQRVRSGKTSTIYGCDLPFWMRLDYSAIGLHVGELPGYPASAGCVRLSEKGARLLFENTTSGVAVWIVDHWSPESLLVAAR